MMDRVQFEAQARNITSHDNDQHAYIVEGLIRWLKPQYCVEVGTNLGGMAVRIARALQENWAEMQADHRFTVSEGDRPMLYCIDDFSFNGANAIANFWYHCGAAGVGEYVSLCAGSSYEDGNWPDRVDFAFVDGDHSYDGCFNDIQKAMQRGAFAIVVHDVADWWGPARWYEAWREEYDPYEWGHIHAPHQGGLAIIMRTSALGPLRWTEDAAPSGAVTREQVLAAAGGDR